MNIIESIIIAINVSLVTRSGLLFPETVSRCGDPGIKSDDKCLFATTNAQFGGGKVEEPSELSLTSQNKPQLLLRSRSRAIFIGNSRNGN